MDFIDEKSEAIINVLNRVICLTTDSTKDSLALNKTKNSVNRESKQKSISLLRKLFTRKTKRTFNEESFDEHTSIKIQEDINNKTVDTPTNIQFENYDNVLGYIFENYGINIIYHKAKFMQLIHNFAENFKTENRLLKFALDLGIYNKLNNTDSTNAKEQNSAYRFAFEQLRNSGIDSANSEKAIMWYTKHLNWKPTISIGKKLFFGNYPFEENGEHRKIEWEIIDIKDGNALLLSTYCIDAHNYDDKTCIWQKSSLNRWLESEFKNNAFSNKENSSIVYTNNETSYNSVNGTDSGNSTTDRIFILSAEQIKRLRLTKEIRISKATPYAKKNGVFCDDLDNFFGG